MLVVAATTIREERAGGRRALRGGLQQIHNARVGRIGGFDARALARQQKRRDEYPALHSSQRTSAVHPLFHHYFVYDRNSPHMSGKPRVLSGIQPTGSPHIGNYLGALKNWVDIQYDYDSIYCIVDLHAITVYQDPAELRAKIEELAGMLLAIGIDPAQSALTVQSAVPEHAELAWMLTCVTPVGWLERMTQYKAKSEERRGQPEALAAAQNETVGSGILQYPVLMAADILLYQA